MPAAIFTRATNSGSSARNSASPPKANGASTTSPASITCGRRSRPTRSTPYGTRAADRFLAPTVDRVVGAAALNNYSYVSDSSPITNSYAAFTQGIWHITPMLDLTGGLRYTYEEKRGYFNQTASGADLSTLTTAQQAAAQAIRAPYGIANSYTARGRVSGQAMLTYKVTPDASPAQDTAVQKWKLHLPIAYDNASPAPPSPDVGHHIENDRLNLAVAEVAFENARSAAEFFARSAFHTMLGQQSRYLDAIGAYLVTGFYTFVRDGVPTTAGFRGSRAELINMVGAANQTAPDIVPRFAPIHEGRG